MSRGSGGSAPPDIYVGLLCVSLVSLFTGCIILAMKLVSYDWQIAS